MVEKLIKKYSDKIKKQKLSTFFKQQKERKNRISFSFNPMVTNKLEPIFKKHNINLVYANENKLKDLLGNSKDTEEKSLNQEYTGQNTKNVINSHTQDKQHEQQKQDVEMQRLCSH